MVAQQAWISQEVEDLVVVPETTTLNQQYKNNQVMDLEINMADNHLNQITAVDQNHHFYHQVVAIIQKQWIWKGKYKN